MRLKIEFQTKMPILIAKFDIVYDIFNVAHNI